MGGNICCCEKGQEPIEEQYQSLVVSKPLPIALEKVEIDQSESDIPLFAPADTDGDLPVISDSDSAPKVDMYSSKKLL